MCFPSTVTRTPCTLCRHVCPSGTLSLVQLMDCPLEGETFDPLSTFVNLCQPLSTFVNLCQDLCQSVPHFALNLIDIESGGSMPKNVPSGSSSAFLRQVLTCKSLRSKSQSANSTEAARLCQAMRLCKRRVSFHGIMALSWALGS